MKRSLHWSLCVVTDRGLAGGRPLAEVVRAAIAGGATLIQLREKEAGTREMLEVGESLLEVTRAAGVPLIVNDRVDVALALDADGVHVGRDDMPAHIARRLIGADRLLGVTVGSAREVLAAEAAGADYLGTDAVFPTPTKPDAGPPLGLEGLREICRVARVPVLGIGGVNAGNAAELIRVGAAGVAVVSAVMAAADVEAAARDLRAVVEAAVRELRDAPGGAAGGRPNRPPRTGLPGGGPKGKERPS